MLACALAMAVVLGVQRIRSRALYKRIRSLESVDSECYVQFSTALEIIHQAFTSHPNKDLALAFNGGKDCLVVFYLVEAYCQHHQMAMPLVVYFEKDNDEFPQMIDFRQRFLLARQSTCRFVTVSGDYKNGLGELKQTYGVQAIFMGTRSTDPYAPSTAFARTTEGWPDLLRISPILNVDYTMLWRFLKLLQLPYCCLYDEGFSSLGPKSTTRKNSELFDEESGRALPAHALQHGDSERGGRRV